MSGATATAFRALAHILSPWRGGADIVSSWQRKGEPDWEECARLAALHKVSQALYPALREKQLLDQVPEELSGFLRELAELSAERNAAIRKQLAELITALNRVGAEPLLLKGSVHYFTDSYASAGDRLSNDIDVLLPASRLSDGVEVLCDLGYAGDVEREHFNQLHHHMAPMLREGEYAAVELHRAIGEAALESALPTGRALELATALDTGTGARARALPLEWRLLHSVLHIEISDRCYEHAQVELRQLHELARLLYRYGDTFDWRALEALAEGSGVSTLLGANLLAARHFLNVPIPRQVLQRIPFGARLHLLRIRARLASPGFEQVDDRLRRLSREQMQREYGARAGGWSLWRCRFDHLMKAGARNRNA